MNAISLPEKEYKHLVAQEPERQFTRRVFTAPDGDLTNNEIAPLDTVISANMKERTMAIHTFWQPSEEDIEVLKDGGVIEFTLLSSELPPVSAQIWGGTKSG